MSVKLFLASVSSNLETKKHQQRIQMVLDSMKIPYEQLDITQSDHDHKAEMRRIAGNPSAMAPQICNGEIYCGDFEAFEEAVERDEINKFLKL